MQNIANAGSWNELKPQLSPCVLRALEQLGFLQMTPVQKSTIPLFMSYKDAVVQAVTGSGKTIAFIIPAIELIMRRIADGRPWQRNEIAALIISPTRELATQIFTVLGQFLDIINVDSSSENRPEFSRALFIGGCEIKDDISQFVKNGAHFVIGTPGRIDDLLKRTNVFNSKEVEVLVLDEADRLLDMGFEKQLSSIITTLPKQRRTALFSATMTDGLNRLVKAGLRNPVSVSVKVHMACGEVLTEQKIPSTLRIYYRICEAHEKLGHLINILLEAPEMKFMVYFSTGACVDYYFRLLSLYTAVSNLKFHSLHGKMDPKRREAVYAKFTASIGGVLICTDVAARGLDIPDIDWVVQFDPPQDPKAFAHRCGRTARIGREGKAIVFLTPAEDTYVEFLSIRNLPITESAVAQVSTDYLQWQRVSASQDRDIYEKGLKAFVSWIRSYKEHQASYIFQLKKLDMGSVARSFGLLRLPKMPELKQGFERRVEFEDFAIDVYCA